MRVSALSVALALGAAACAAPQTAETRSPSPGREPALTQPPEPESVHAPPAEAAAPACGGKPLTVLFFDVGQGLSALVKLPDDRNILIDAGESPTRPACGAPCKDWNARLLAALPAALGTPKLDALWITHQHSDHLGGVPSILNGLSLGVYIDNGRDLGKAGVNDARNAALASGAQILVESPGDTTPPLPATKQVKLTPVLPAAWPHDCVSGSPPNPNECSIALRIDYCRSSILFTGDAGEGDGTSDGGIEPAIDPGEIGLLQVGHHGSATSSSEPFLQKIRPKYAVISSGKIDEGTNAGYCHPRAVTVTALTAVMGGAGTTTIKAFDGSVKCGANKPTHWLDIPSNDHLWSTARDGDVVLITKGDGSFTRVTDSSPPTEDACCKTCTNSKPCGDTCIPKANTCTKAPGCACAAQ